MSTTTTHSKTEKRSAELSPSNPLPSLRFKEFEGELTKYKLDDIVTFRSGGTPSKKKDTYWTGDIPWISAASMLGKYYAKSERKITEEGLKNGSKLALKGSLLLLVRGSMLFNKIPIGIVERDVAFNQDLKTITPNEKLDNEFLYQWFSAKQNFLLHKVTVTGIGVGKLDTESLKSLNLLLPSLPEQQKIASFLSAVDEKIMQLTKKKALLVNYKKGIMQQLFGSTESGHAANQLRFKDEHENDYPDWKEKRLGEIDLVISDGNYGEMYPKASEMKDSGVPFIRANNIKGLNILWNDMRFIDDDLHSNLLSGHLKTNDILVTTRGQIGLVAFVKEEFDGANINAQICLLRSGKGINPNYLLHALGSKKGKSQFRKLQTGSVLKQLPKRSLKAIELGIPFIEEQQKIGSYLSHIDIKIEEVNNQETQTQTLRKGLLQKLFV